MVEPKPAAGSRDLQALVIKRSLSRFAGPAGVTAAVAVLYLGQVQYSITHHLDYVKMDHADVRLVSSSDVIRKMAAEGPVHRDGYDGQFSYFIALDPAGAMELGPYRYSRIGYPLAARALAFGKAERVRASLTIVNALAIIAATFFLALIFAHWRRSAWWALLIATYPGLMLSAFTRDTSEPLAYAFALAGVWIVLRADVVTTRVAIAAGSVFALAALTRETTLLFPLALACTIRRNSTLALLAAAGLPYLAWKAFITWHFHDPGMSSLFTPVPFSGIVTARPWTLSAQGLVILTVLLPAVVGAVLAGRALLEKVSFTPLVLLINCLFLLFLDSTVFDGYGSTGRVATGAAIAAMVAFPVLRQTWGRSIALIGVGLWSLPWWVLANHVVT
jgi:hypothetical protein